MVLHIITPADSVRDRLAGFLFWNDRGSLDQAIAVTRANRERVDLPRVRRWCQREGRSEEYRVFERSLATGR